MYRYRIYPNKKQKELIQKTFGCCRFVYNYFLDLRIKEWKENKKTLNFYDCTKLLTQLKEENEWLKEPDKCSLQNSLKNLDNAYQYFFKRSKKYPKFKSKHNHRKSYTTNFIRNNIEVSFDKNKIKLPKLKWIKSKIHREFNGIIKGATILQVPSGKYFVSVLVETQNIQLECTGSVIGIDLGIKDLIITSDGEKFDNIHTIKKYEDKLAKEQRKLAHKQKGSKNHEKQRIKVAKIYEKITNIRKDNLHKITHKLINENQVICCENLQISKMMKNHNLAKSIADASWGEIVRQLEYKANWYNKKIIKIDTWFSSSQICSCCGNKFSLTKDLSIREWKCPICNTLLDRDTNAAINILNEGLRMLNIV